MYGVSRNARLKLVGASLAALAVAGGGVAIAAAKPWSPRAESQAVINDAAKQLGVTPTQLSNALKRALKNRVDDVRVITHLSSRGSNDLENRDIVSFYTAPSPRLYAQFAALDARFGTRNTIALWYVDRFNQTCGRNRGFRGQHGRDHIAVMGYRMYKWLVPYLVTWSRYAFPRRRCSIPGGGRG